MKRTVCFFSSLGTWDTSQEYRLPRAQSLHRPVYRVRLDLGCPWIPGLFVTSDTFLLVACMRASLLSWDHPGRTLASGLYPSCFLIFLKSVLVATHFLSISAPLSALWRSFPAFCCSKYRSPYHHSHFHTTPTPSRELSHSMLPGLRQLSPLKAPSPKQSFASLNRTGHGTL